MSTTIDITSGSGEPVRVLIACQRRLLALGMEALLAPLSDMEFVGIAASTTLLRAHLMRSRIDVLVVAWGSAGGQSKDILLECAAGEDSPKLIVMSSAADADAIREAFTCGAAGYVSEESDDEQIIDALRAVADGRIVIETGARRFTPDELSGIAGPGTLTERERAVLTLIASGLSTKQIAQSLFLSPKTVETHRSNIMRKLDLASVADTVRYALRTGLLTQVSFDEQAEQESSS